MLKDKILDDISDRAILKLAGLVEKMAAGKGGISNPMGGSASSTASKPVKAAPIMSAAPINDLMPKATTALTAGLPNLMNNMNQATQQATQSGVMNNAVLPWNNKSGEYNLEKTAEMDKEAGPLLRSLGRLARRNLARTPAGTIPRESQLPPVKMDPVREAIKPAVDYGFDNVVRPAVQGFFGSGTADGILANILKGGSKIPGLRWTQKGVDKFIDAADKLGKMGIPDNPVAKKVHNISKTLGKYDGYLAAGSTLASVLSLIGKIG